MSTPYFSHAPSGAAGRGIGTWIAGSGSKVHLQVSSSSDGTTCQIGHFRNYRYIFRQMERVSKSVIRSYEFSYLLRMAPPDIIEASTVAHDEAILQCLSHILGS